MNKLADESLGGCCAVTVPACVETLLKQLGLSRDNKPWPLIVLNLLPEPYRRAFGRNHGLPELLTPLPHVPR